MGGRFADGLDLALILRPGSCADYRASYGRALGRRGGANRKPRDGCDEDLLVAAPLSRTFPLMKSAMWTLSMLVAASAVGCGGGGGTALTPDGGGGDTSTATGGGSCGQVQPCGGAIVGSWKVSSSCILDASFQMDASSICTTATIALKKVTGVGGITYGGDQTYQSTGTLSIDFTLSLPTTCFAAGKTCADLQTTYTKQMQTDPTLTSATCASSGSTCVCQLSTTQDATESGTYTTSGTIVSSTPAGGTVSNDSYCVKVNELPLLSVFISFLMGNIVMVKITVVIFF